MITITQLIPDGEGGVTREVQSVNVTITDLGFNPGTDNPSGVTTQAFVAMATSLINTQTLIVGLLNQ